MKIFIQGTRNSETPEKLAFHLKDCESGFEIPEGDYFVVNYGLYKRNANLNKTLVLNKKEQMELLRNGGINIPKVYTFPNQTTLISREIPLLYFPLLARKIKHAKGTDIIFLDSRLSLRKRSKRVRNRDFFVEYIPKKTEFRVHVVGDSVINVSKKIKSENSEFHHPHVWSSVKGWTLETYEGEKVESLSELALKTIKILNYDFGAVDIIVGEDDKYYVLEVNSAPRLNRTRRKLYTKFFRAKEKEFSEGRTE